MDLAFQLPPSPLDYHAEHSIPASEYQAHFDTYKNDYILRLVTGFEDAEGAVFYNTIWHKNTAGTAWASRHGMTDAEYQQSFDENTQAGCNPCSVPVFVDGFTVGGQPRINVIYEISTDPIQVSARHGQAPGDYQTHFNEKTSVGYDLDIVSVYECGDCAPTQRVASLMSKQTNNNAWAARHVMNAVQYQAEFNYFVSNRGYTLTYLSVGSESDGSANFAAIWEKTNGGPAWAARHSVLRENVGETLFPFLEQGYVPTVIDGYVEGSQTMFAFLLVKVGADVSEIEANGPTFPETECLDAMVVNFMTDNQIRAASIAVMLRGKIVYSQGYGVRDVPGMGNDLQARKTMPYTPFRLASISKPITGLAVLRLIQRGDLSLDDRAFHPQTGILKDLRNNPKPGLPVVDSDIDLITVQMLLQHTGGWDIDILNFDPMFYSSTVSSALGITGPVQCLDVIYYMFNTALNHPPGTFYAYSNFGYCILGRIIEVVTGKSYEQAVRELLLDPAGVRRSEMYQGATQYQDTRTYEAEYECPGCNLATSVFPNVQEQVPNPYGAWHLEAMDAHGGWVASAQELMEVIKRTAPSHCNGTDAGINDVECLLWAETVDALEAQPAHVPPGDTRWYGLGFGVRSFSSSMRRWAHDGSLPGTSTVLRRTADGVWSWAFLTNRRGFGGNMYNLMATAVGCVGSSWSDWPSGFQVTHVPASELGTAPGWNFWGWGRQLIQKTPVQVPGNTLAVSVSMFNNAGGGILSELPMRVHLDTAEFGLGFNTWKELGQTALPTVREMEAGFGHDLSNVNAQALAVNLTVRGNIDTRAVLGAKVYVVFDGSQVPPPDRALVAQELEAHEAAHVVQQSRGGRRVLDGEQPRTHFRFSTFGAESAKLDSALGVSTEERVAQTREHILLSRQAQHLVLFAGEETTPILIPLRNGGSGTVKLAPVAEGVNFVALDCLPPLPAAREQSIRDAPDVALESGELDALFSDAPQEPSPDDSLRACRSVGLLLPAVQQARLPPDVDGDGAPDLPPDFEGGIELALAPVELSDQRQVSWADSDSVGRYLSWVGNNKVLNGRWDGSYSDGRRAFSDGEAASDMGWTPLAVETAVLRVQGGLEGAAPEEVNVAVTVVRVRVEQLLNAPWMCCIKSLRTRVKMERMLADALMQVEDEDWCAAIRLVRQVMPKVATTQCGVEASEQLCFEKTLSALTDAARMLAIKAGVPKEEIFHADELRRSGLLEAATAAFQRSCDAATGIVDPPSP